MRNILQDTTVIGGTRRETEFHGIHGPCEYYVPLSEVELNPTFCQGEFVCVCD